jgi:hypothetical protein
VNPRSRNLPAVDNSILPSILKRETTVNLEVNGQRPLFFGFLSRPFLFRRLYFANQRVTINRTLHGLVERLLSNRRKGTTWSHSYSVLLINVRCQPPCRALSPAERVVSSVYLTTTSLFHPRLQFPCRLQLYRPNAPQLVTDLVCLLCAFCDIACTKGPVATLRAARRWREADVPGSFQTPLNSSPPHDFIT